MCMYFKIKLLSTMVTKVLSVVLNVRYGMGGSP